MAIRLHPQCSPRVMEQLVGVPTGTYDRLEAFIAKRPDHVGPAQTAWYDKLYRDENLIRFHQFESFGWGRLSSRAMEYKKKHFPDSEYAGSTDDPELAQGFIQAQGIVAEGVTSVRWN